MQPAGLKLKKNLRVLSPKSRWIFTMRILNW
jgi:hypothetical protein